MNTTEARALFDRLVNRIAPEIDPATADPRAPIQDALELDSMDFLNLVTALHEVTGVEVPEHDYPKLATIDGFVTYVVDRTPCR